MGRNSRLRRRILIIKGEYMKHTKVLNNEGKAAHVRRNMWGRIVRPSNAMASFKELQSSGFYHSDYTWKQCCAAYRKKMRKIRIAKESRRRNRR